MVLNGEGAIKSVFVICCVKLMSIFLFKNVSTASLLGEELFFLLQSLVMACQSQDAEALSGLEGDLWKYLSNEQRDMLRIVIDNMNNIEK